MTDEREFTGFSYMRCIETCTMELATIAKEVIGVFTCMYALFKSIYLENRDMSDLLWIKCDQLSAKNAIN